MDNQEKWNKIMEFLKRALRVKGELVKNEKAIQYFMMENNGTQLKAKNGEFKCKGSYMNNREKFSDSVKCLM